MKSQQLSTLKDQIFFCVCVQVLENQASETNRTMPCNVHERGGVLLPAHQPIDRMHV